MQDFANFFTQHGFPAGVAIALLFLAYKVGSRLVDRHIAVLDNVEATQRKMLEVQTLMLSKLEELSRNDRDHVDGNSRKN